ncbi:MAG: hypothetical protein JO079_08715 [Frankiaceae bacterium]|nr:hypothetical protein [Frankiaceae bacterium]
MRTVRRLVVAALLPLVVVGCGSGGQSPGGSAGTVSGVVLSAPSCPVERAGSPCPPRTVSGADVVAVRAGKTVAHVRAGADGRFEFQFAAGDYTVTARQVGGIGTSASAMVVVRAGLVATVTLTVDSGIR